MMSPDHFRIVVVLLIAGCGAGAFEKGVHLLRVFRVPEEITLSIAAFVVAAGIAYATTRKGEGA